MAEHGTRSRYSYQKCRCQACKDANAAYQRERYDRQRSQIGGRIACWTCAQPLLPDHPMFSDCYRAGIEQLLQHERTPRAS